MILGEYDRYVPSLPGPSNLDVLAHSPVAGQRNWSDLTSYTAPGNGGGVLASGSASFVAQLSTTGIIPPTWCPDRGRGVRRVPPGHGEPVRPLRSRPCHHVRHVEWQLARRLLRSRRLGCLGRRHSIRLTPHGRPA